MNNDKQQWNVWMLHCENTKISDQCCWSFCMIDLVPTPRARGGAWQGNGRSSIVRPFCRSAVRSFSRFCPSVVLSFGRSVVRPFTLLDTGTWARLEWTVVGCSLLFSWHRAKGQARVSQQSAVQLTALWDLRARSLCSWVWSCFAKFPGVPRFCHLSERFVVLQNYF